MDCRFGNDVRVEAVAEVDRVDVITMRVSVNAWYVMTRSGDFEATQKVLVGCDDTGLLPEHVATVAKPQPSSASPHRKLEGRRKDNVPL
jgi:hypothetical protein